MILYILFLFKRVALNGKFTEIVNKVNNFVWGPVMLVFLVGTGIFLT